MPATKPMRKKMFRIEFQATTVKTPHTEKSSDPRKIRKNAVAAAMVAPTTLISGLKL